MDQLCTLSARSAKRDDELTHRTCIVSCLKAQPESPALSRARSVLIQTQTENQNWTPAFLRHGTVSCNSAQLQRPTSLVTTHPSPFLFISPQCYVTGTTVNRGWPAVLHLIHCVQHELHASCHGRLHASLSDDATMKNGPQITQTRTSITSSCAHITL